MKKAQIKMGETIAILFVFFVLILFGLIFYFQWQKSSFERQKVEIFSEQSISKSLLATYMPELICSEIGVDKDNCIDMEKLMLFADEVENNKEYYFDILGFAVLRVEEIYPGDDNFTFYDQKPEEFTRKISTPVPISLYWSIDKKYSFGVLYVETYT